MSRYVGRHRRSSVTRRTTDTEEPVMGEHRRTGKHAGNGCLAGLVATVAIIGAVIAAIVVAF